MKNLTHVGESCVRPKKENGITLIALVITIIVLLILAGITLTLVMGENGLIAKAQQAGVNYSEAENTENQELAKLNNQMEEYTTITRGEGTSQGTAYSLEEVKTSDTWMGKPLYTKTVYIPSLPNATTQYYAHEIENVERIWVSVDNSFIITGDTAQTIPMVHTTNLSGQIEFAANATSAIINTGNMNRTSYAAYVTVKYTKTTDTVAQ